MLRVPQHRAGRFSVFRSIAQSATISGPPSLIPTPRPGLNRILCGDSEPRHRSSRGQSETSGHRLAVLPGGGRARPFYGGGDNGSGPGRILLASSTLAGRCAQIHRDRSSRLATAACGLPGGCMKGRLAHRNARLAEADGDPRSARHAAGRSRPLEDDVARSPGVARDRPARRTAYLHVEQNRPVALRARAGWLPLAAQPSLDQWQITELSPAVGSTRFCSSGRPAQARCIWPGPWPLGDPHGQAYPKPNSKESQPLFRGISLLMRHPGFDKCAEPCRETALAVRRR